MSILSTRYGSPSPTRSVVYLRLFQIECDEVLQPGGSRRTRGSRRKRFLVGKPVSGGYQPVGRCTKAWVCYCLDDDEMVFSCVPGIIRVTGDGVVVESLELYSEPGSENRPLIGPDLRVLMDAGAENQFK